MKFTKIYLLGEEYCGSIFHKLFGKAHESLLVKHKTCRAVLSKGKIKWVKF